MVYRSTGIIVVDDAGTIEFVGGPHDYHLQETEQLCAALS
jgi:hypothetical protein